MDFEFCSCPCFSVLLLLEALWSSSVINLYTTAACHLLPATVGAVAMAAAASIAAVDRTLLPVVVVVAADTAAVAAVAASTTTTSVSCRAYHTSEKDQENGKKTQLRKNLYKT